MVKLEPVNLKLSLSDAKSISAIENRSFEKKKTSSISLYLAQLVQFQVLAKNDFFRWSLLDPLRYLLLLN